jgi:topoisomerase-4 subunit A
LRKLEEIAIKKEHQELTEEQADLEDLMTKEDRRWKVIGGEIQELKKAYGPKTELGRRRTEVTDAPADVVVPLEAVVEREPVTVLLSAKGWIRAMKGHHEDLSEAKYKEGDREGFVVPCHTTDKLLLFATNGRFYTLSVDKLPGGRGFGEPVRLMIDLPNDQEVLAARIPTEGRKLLVAASDGRGFVVAEDEVIAQTKNGKQVLNLGSGAEAAVCYPLSEGDDCVAVVGDNRKLLLFPLAEVPEMARGRGVILQRYKDGGLSDAKTFRKDEGLSWSAGPGRVRTETALADWQAKRAHAGRLPPKGFPTSKKFGV